CAPTELDRLAVGQQLAAMRHHREPTERQARRRFEGGIGHQPSVYGFFRGFQTFAGPGGSGHAASFAKSAVRARSHRLSNSTNWRIIAAYCERTPNSAKRHREALGRFPGGIVHDARHMRPYGVYVERAQAARKWDLDGHEYVDYCGGHGALLLGHAHPKVMDAVQAQLAKGMHFAAPNDLEVEWARLVQDLIPLAAVGGLQSLGTEGPPLSTRVARGA